MRQMNTDNLFIFSWGMMISAWIAFPFDQRIPIGLSLGALIISSTAMWIEKKKTEKLYKNLRTKK